MRPFILLLFSIVRAAALTVAWDTNPEPLPGESGVSATHHYVVYAQPWQDGAEPSPLSWESIASVEHVPRPDPSVATETSVELPYSGPQWVMVRAVSETGVEAPNSTVLMTGWAPQTVAGARFKVTIEITGE